MYFVGADGVLTSVGFNSTVKTDGGIPFHVTIDRKKFGGYGGYGTTTAGKVDSINTSLFIGM